MPFLFIIMEKGFKSFRSRRKSRTDGIGMCNEDFAKELFRDHLLHFEPWMKKYFTLDEAYASVKRGKMVETRRQYFANLCRHFTWEERF